MMYSCISVLLFVFLISVLLGLLLLFLSLLFGIGGSGWTAKSMLFECGFESNLVNRVPFSLQFFIIGLIFVLFDLEIVVVILIFFSKLGIGLISVLVLINVFFFLLFFGWFLEWKAGSYAWLN